MAAPNIPGNDPPAPQSQVVRAAGANKTARTGAYTDPNLTTRNAEGSAAASDLPPPADSTTTGSVRPVYAADQDKEIDNTAAATANAGVDQPPHSPNSWKMRNGRPRDPYANSGQDDYLDN